MIQIKLDKKKKNILIAGTILLLLGGIYRFFPTITEFWKNDGEIEIKTQTISKYQQRIQNKSALEKTRLELTKDLENLRHGLLSGQTPALAAVSVQNRINEIAGNLDIEIQSIRPIKPEDVEGSELIQVGVELIIAQMTIRQLKELIYKIETSEQIMQIRKLDLRKRNEEPPIQIRAIMTVDGFMQTPNRKDTSD